MSIAVPQFCPLGNYFYDDFSTKRIADWSFGANSDVNTALGELQADPTYSNKSSVSAISVSKPSGSQLLTAEGRFRCSFPGYSASASMAHIIFEEGLNQVIAGYGPDNTATNMRLYLFNGSWHAYSLGIPVASETTRTVRLELTATTANVYDDGVLRISQPYSGTFNKLSVVVNSISTTYGHCTYIYAHGPTVTGGDGACLGEAPTYHREAPGSTLKVSHARDVLSDRSAAQAKAFHEIMRGKTV